MLLKNLILGFVLFIFLPSSLLAEQLQPAELFQQGTQAYVRKDYAKAVDLLEQALAQDKHNATIITNLALAQYNLGKIPVALGLLRKAIYLDPSLSTAKESLEFVVSQAPKTEVPRQIQNYESLRSQLLQPVPLYAYSLLSLLCFLAAGWTLLNFLGKRKKALEEQTSSPGFPVVGTLLGLAFIIFSGLLVLKLYDTRVLRGTIIEEKISLQTAPGENQLAILDLYGGMEVIIRSTQGDWSQVTYPGSLTGWVKNSSLLMTR